MSSNFSRVGSASAFNATINNLGKSFSELADLQEKLTAKKKVLRPSDDPTGAAQAERAQTRMARVETEQRALAMQRNTIATTDSTLGSAATALQEFRELVLSAGNPSYSDVERSSIAQRLTSLRNQLLTYANTQDSNGLPLFSGLGSSGTPFVDQSGGMVYQGIPGQLGSSDVSVTPALDGQAAWMNVRSGNGVFNVNNGAANSGAAWADAGQLLNTGDYSAGGGRFQVDFQVDAQGATTYTVTSLTDNTTSAPAAYVSGQQIAFGGMALTIKGAPHDGDSFSTSDSTRLDLFAVLDDAINTVKTGAVVVGSSNNTSALNQGLARALAQIDTGMAQLQASRTVAGDLLNRIDRIDDGQEAKAIQLEADRSRAEDIDLIRGLSEFQNKQTAHSAALGTYAQIQKLSLFNYIS